MIPAGRDIIGGRGDSRQDLPDSCMMIDALRYFPV